MYLITNSEKVIVAAASYAVNEDECATRGESVVQVKDSEFHPAMIGGIYIEHEPTLRVELRPSKLHIRHNGEWVIAADLNPTRERVLGRRHNLLSKSDWTQLPDVEHPLKDEWAAWRRAVRAVDASGDLRVANQTLIDLEKTPPEPL